MGDTVKYRKKLVSNKAHIVTVKILLSSSKHLIISKILNENIVLFFKPGNEAIVRKAHVSQLKSCMN